MQAVKLWDVDGQTLSFLMTMYEDFGEPHLFHDSKLLLIALCLWNVTFKDFQNASVCSQRSLPALRQMTPDAEAFIQQSLLPQTSTPAATASTALAAVVLRPPLSTAASTSTSAALTKTTVIGLTQTPHSKPTLVI